jgi:hypothetical protein
MGFIALGLARAILGYIVFGALGGLLGGLTLAALAIGCPVPAPRHCDERQSRHVLGA